MTVSAFVRSLSLEGIDVGPFLGEGGRAVLRRLADGMHAIGPNLDQIARAIDTGRGQVKEDLAGEIKNARIVAATAAEMIGRSAALRCRDTA